MIGRFIESREILYMSWQMNEECLICNAPLEYLATDEMMECELCHKTWKLLLLQVKRWVVTEVIEMANENKKDFNAMLQDSKDMPKFQTITDLKSIKKYGGDLMYFAPPIDYDKIMKQVPPGKIITVGKIREYFAKVNGADFTEPITAGIFVSIAAWASHQREEDKTPYWRTLKAKGELNAKYPGGIEAQKKLLEQEGHTIIQKGRKHIKYYVKDYENVLFDLVGNF